MLMPSKKHVYTTKWKALGQRVLCSNIFIPFKNGQSHLITLNWKINEHSNRKTWFEISAERIITTNEYQIKEPSHLIAVSLDDVTGKETKKLSHYSSIILSQNLNEVLKMAGIIEDRNPREVMEFAKRHIKSVDRWRTSKDDLKTPTEIKSWLDEQLEIGIQRVPLHDSIFSSNLTIDHCKMF
jgi:hypothetical protein